MIPGACSCDLSAGSHREGLVTVVGAIQTRRYDSLAGSAQTAKLAGLCHWAGSVETTEAGRFFVSALFVTSARGDEMTVCRLILGAGSGKTTETR